MAFEWETLYLSISSIFFMFCAFRHDITDFALMISGSMFISSAVIYGWTHVWYRYINF